MGTYCVTWLRRYNKIIMYITKETKEADAKIMKIASSFKAQFTPLNANHIYTHILKKKKNIGILGFSYAFEEVNIDTIKEKFSEVKIPSRPLRNVYKEKVKESIDKFALIQCRGTTEFFEASKKVYGYPSKKLLNAAHDILSLSPGLDHDKITLFEAKKMLKHALQEMKLPWKVTTKKMLSYAMVQTAKNTVTLSSSHSFSEKSIKRLAIHEIGTHSVRTMNGRLQPLKIFKNFPRYIQTEEGLAAFNEDITGYLYNDTIRKYAGRVIAVDYAQNHTLLETFEYLKKYFTEQQALNIAVRIKRGLPNTESHGAFTKDYVYLQGFLDIKKYVLKKPLQLLYYGKINHTYASLIKKLEPELTPIKYYPPLLQNYERKKEIMS